MAANSFAALCCALIFAGASHAQVPVRAGIETNTNSDLNRLLQAPKMAAPLWFASTDKTGGNDDFVWLNPGETRKIPLAPGTLERVWSTSLAPEKLELQLQAGPRRVFPLLGNGVARAGNFSDKAYTLYPETKYPALQTLGVGATLIATNRAKERVKWYYQASVRPPSNTLLPQIPPSKEAAKRQFKLDLKSGETKIVENFTTPGLIFEVSVAVAEGSSKGVFQNLRFQASFEDKPAIDAPLLALAGQMRGEEFLSNAVCDFDGFRLLLRWPMPFESARLALKNDGPNPVKLDVMVRLQKFDKAPSDYRFCAVQGSAKTQKGQPVSILNLKGEGALAGLALAIAPQTDSPRRTFAYLEGDEKIVADGKIYEGTGTEDYFSSAWYFPEKPFFFPYEGLTLKTQAPPSVAMYRFHIPDPIPFKRDLKFDFEHGNGNNSDDLEWQWTAFWYQKPPLSIPENVSQAVSSGQTAAQSGDGYKRIFLVYGAGLAVLLGLVALRLRRK